jgi:hypothetical protein
MQKIRSKWKFLVSGLSLRPGVLFISARLRPPGDPMKARLPFRGLPRADTKITVGFGPQAAALNLAL